MAEVVKKMCKQDLRAFCFLSSYFTICLYKLEAEGRSVAQLGDMYDSVIALLCKTHRPAPVLSLIHI